MSKALLKYIRLSPIKARLIAREIQGMNAELALATLEFAPNKAAAVIYKVLASAIANGNYDAQSVIVKSCRIDAGPVLRRMSPRARGRANMIRKPTSHILVEVATESEIAKAIESAKVKATKPKKENAKSAKKVSTKATNAKSGNESKGSESSGESKKAVMKAPKKEVVKVESKEQTKSTASTKTTKPKTSKVDSVEKATKKSTKTSVTKSKASQNTNKTEDKDK